jgi:hypothetical protein
LTPDDGITPQRQTADTSFAPADGPATREGDPVDGPLPAAPPGERGRVLADVRCPTRIIVAVMLPALLAALGLVASGVSLIRGNPSGLARPDEDVPIGRPAGQHERQRQQQDVVSLLTLASFAFVVLWTPLIVWSLRLRLRVWEHGLAWRGLMWETWLPYADIDKILLLPLNADLTVIDPRCRPWKLPCFIGRNGRRLSRGLGLLPIDTGLFGLYLAVEQIVPRLGQKARDRLSCGEEIVFKPVTAAWAGLILPDGGTLPWGNIERVDFSAAGLYVFVRGRPDASFVLSYETPSLHVLVWLCERMPSLVAIQAAVQLTGPRQTEQPPATPAIRAAEEFRPAGKSEGNGPPPAPAAEAEPSRPVAPVSGFPAHDPELGHFLGGKPRRPRLALLSLVFAGVYFVFVLVNLFWPPLALDVWGLLLTGLLPGVVLIALGGRRDGPHLLGCAAGVFFMVLLLVGLVSSGVDQPGKQSFSVTYAPLWVPLSLCLAGLASWGMARREGFAVYEEGLRDYRRALRWSECRHLTYAAVDQQVNLARGVRTVAMTLEGPAGSLNIGGRDVVSEACCQTVLQRVLPLLVGRAWQALAAGGEFRAGPVRLTSKELTYKGRQVPLAAVRSFRPHLGRLYLWIKGQEQPLLNEDLNARDRRVLLALVEVLGRANR